MDIQTISTKELRQNFSQVISAMKAGQPLVLFYRSQPLAEIKPITKPPQPRSFSTKQLKRWIKDDQITPKKQRQIDQIINRLP